MIFLRSAINIGIWFQILQIMSYLAILTNSALIIFTSSALHVWFKGYNQETLIWAAVLIEVISIFEIHSFFFKAHCISNQICR